MIGMLKTGFIGVCISLLFATIAFAEIPIYCPKCKTLIYNYQKDEVVKGSVIKAEDFKPANDLIPQPQDGEPMICPLDGALLNGWEYWAKKQHFKSFTFAYQAVSLLSKDKDGNWLWVGDNFSLLNMDEVNK